MIIFKVGQSFEFEFRRRSREAATVRYMPKSDKPRKPKTPTARQQIVNDLRIKAKAHKKALSKVNRDLKSFGVGKKKKAKNAAK